MITQQEAEKLFRENEHLRQMNALLMEKFKELELKRSSTSSSHLSSSTGGGDDEDHEAELPIHSKFYEKKTECNTIRKDYLNTLDRVNQLKLKLLSSQVARVLEEEEKMKNAWKPTSMLTELSSIMEYNTLSDAEEEEEDKKNKQEGGEEDQKNPFHNKTLITIKIDDKKYRIAKRSLMSSPSILAIMLADDRFKVDTDSEGNLVVHTMMNKHFLIILKYLQYQNFDVLDIPKNDRHFLLSLLDELNFFNVVPLVDYVTQLLKNLDVVNDLNNDSNMKYETSYGSHFEDSADFYVELEILKLQKHEDILSQKLESMKLVESELEQQLKMEQQQQQPEIISSSAPSDFLMDLVLVFSDLTRYTISKELLATRELKDTLFTLLRDYCLLNKKTEVFIDRDGDLFKVIHEFILNNFVLDLSNISAKRKQLLREEATFYNFTTLLDALNPFRYPFELLGPEYLEMKKMEDNLRTMFCKDRNNPILNDPEIMCVPVLECLEDLKPDLTPRYEDLLFDFAQRKMIIEEDYCPPTPTAITDPKHFFRNFTCLTSYALKGLNWNNVIAAGGSVLCALCQPKDPKELHASVSTMEAYLNFYYHQITKHHNAFADCDIDLFLYNLDESQARQKIVEIYNCIKSNSNDQVLIIRTPLSITFLTQDKKPIQIILRIYKSPAEVLCGFDIDSCCVAFDGQQVLALPRFCRAMRTSINIVDVDRQSKNFEQRLYKYALRGFRVKVAGFQRNKVRRLDLHKQSGSPVRMTVRNSYGLAKLLVLERRFLHPKPASIYMGATPRTYLASDTESDYLSPYIHPRRGLSMRDLQRRYEYSLRYVDYGFLLQLDDIDTIVNGEPGSAMDRPVKFETIEPTTQRVGSFFPTNINFLIQAYTTNEEYAELAIKQGKRYIPRWYWLRGPSSWSAFSPLSVSTLEQAVNRQIPLRTVTVQEGNHPLEVDLYQMYAKASVLGWCRVIREVEVLEPL